MRFTIERLRVVILIAGALLIAALAVLFIADKWKHSLNRHDLPKRLGVDIQQEENGFTFTQARGGHTFFKIDASKVVQLKQGYAMLHDVRIVIFDADGHPADQIQGSEFEYNQRAGTAKAKGPVEIALVRPASASSSSPDQGSPAAQVHVKTSGLVFDQNSGLASTSEPVEFVLAQGTGSADGATFDSEQGLLILDHAVKMSLRRGADTAELQAAHAEFERAGQACRLTGSTLRDRGSQLQSAMATVHFRNDGSAAQLEAERGLSMTSATGNRVTAQAGTLQFDTGNHPQHGVLQGGVTLDAVTQDRTLNASAPTATLEFKPEGILRQVHLERGVRMSSESRQASSHGTMRSHATWNSPVADLEFHETGHGGVELAAIHGSGGVVVQDRTQRTNGVVTPSSLEADDLSGTFGPGSVLTTMTGTGHAQMEQTTASGVKETTSGDRLVAQFATQKQGSSQLATPMGGAQIESVVVEGNVVLTEIPPASAGKQTASPSRATASKAVFQSASGRIELTGSPHVDNGDLQLSARTIDFAQATGDAQARGDIKASWLGGSNPAPGRLTDASPGAGALGEQGPTHAIADEADLHQSAGEVELRGHARLWQASNSVSAPVILLNRTKQTLLARAAGPAEPVQVVMVSATGLSGGKQPRSSGPSVIRLRGGDLKYSAEERKAVIHGGVLDRVVVESAGMQSTSNDAEVYLLRPGNHAGRNGAPAQVDRLDASGRVSLNAQGRIGTGERLEYTSDSGNYVLTGTPSHPPELVDPVRGSVTGQALIFNSRDDSVRVESAKGQTTTETAAPGGWKRRSKAPVK